MTPAAELRGVSKRFARTGGGVSALTDLDLEIAAGEAVGVIGRNGAGKTTLLKLLAGLLLPDSGSLRIEGVDAASDPERVRARVGLVSSHERSWYGRLTIRQNLRFFGRLRGLDGTAIVRRTAQLSDRLGLHGLLDSRAQALSSGNLQRCAVARAVLAQPALVLLDEPTRSLDESAARQVREFIREERARRQGVTLVVATHQARDLEAMCDRVLELDDGRARGKPAPIVARFAQQSREEVRVVARNGGDRPWPRPLPPDLADTPCECDSSGDLVIRLVREPGDGRLHVALRALIQDGFEIVAVESAPRLRDALAPPGAPP